DRPIVDTTGYLMGRGAEPRRPFIDRKTRRMTAGIVRRTGMKIIRAGWKLPQEIARHDRRRAERHQPARLSRRPARGEQFIPRFDRRDDQLWIVAQEKDRKRPRFQLAAQQHNFPRRGHGYQPWATASRTTVAAQRSA